MAASRGVSLALCLGIGFTTAALPARPQRGGAGGADLWCPRFTQYEPVLERIIREGPEVWGDSGVPENSAPPWMDPGRVAAGKAFVDKYPMAIMYGHIHALYLLFTVPSVLDVLVYTRNSDTPDEAFHRYLDTVEGVASWYKSDFLQAGSWGYEELRRVRSLHALVRGDMKDREDRDPAALRNRTRLHGTFTGCPVSAAVRRDLDRHVRRTCGQQADLADNTIGGRPQQEKDSPSKRRNWMSQYDMAATQWAFVGPIIQFPEKYGIGNATLEELDGFSHLWEVLGYTLGIEDRYNFCQGGYEPTVRRSREFLAGVVLPSLRAARPPWEYMARCMADGLGYILPSVTFHSQLANLLQSTLDAPAPSVQRLLSPLQRQSSAGYRGLMRDLREDRALLGTSWSPRLVVELIGNQVLGSVRSIPQDDVRKWRHRPPHSTNNCRPDLD